MDEHAVSDVVGSVLLTGLAVVILAGFGAVVFSNIMSETTTAPSGAFALTPREGESFVDIAFVSGTPFVAESAVFALHANHSPAANSSFVISTATDGRMHPGDLLRVNLSAPLAAGDPVVLFVVHKETGKSIGSAYSKVVGPTELPAYVGNAPTILATLQTPSQLTSDGVAVANLSVTIDSTFGLDLVEAVWLNLTPVGGPAAFALLDDGANGDLLAKDGTYSGRATVPRFNFSANPGAETVAILATVRDVLGHESTSTMQLALRSPIVTKVVQGAYWRDLPAASYAANLNLTNFSFRDPTVLDDDLLELRVSDFADPSRAWTAVVEFNSTACGGAPGIVRVTLQIDGTPGSASYAPASGCFPIDRYSQINLVNPAESLNASNATQAWTVVGNSATCAYQASGIGPTNQGAITFLGDAASPGVTQTGLGQGDITWRQTATGLGTVPTSPTALVATPGDGQVFLSWNAPTSDGGNSIVGYQIYQGATSGSLTLLATIGTNTTFVSNGLANGVTHYYRITATNIAGESPRSAEASATPGAAPSAPQSLVATPWNGAVALAWSAPASSGGSAVTSYNVYVDGSLLASAPGNLSFNATGLANGVSYSFTVKAVNALGESIASNVATATPRTVPSAPTSLAAAAANASAILSWTAPFDGGSSITNYNIYRDGLLLATTGTNTSFTVNSLTNGVAYAFNVTAVNALGESAPSTGASVTPGSVPNPPTGLGATPSNASVALSWTAPANPGGSAITNYNIYRDGALLATIGTNTTFAVNTLANGVAYAFNVTATNALGESAKSNTVTATPVSVANPPTALAGTIGNGTVSLSWAAPTNTGGSSITNYNVYRNGTLLAATGGANTSFAVNSLANGVSYSFTVTTVNAQGQSAASNAIASTPATIPNPPTSLAGTAGASSISLSWNAPSVTGGSPLTNYQIFVNGTFVATTGGTNTTFSANNLLNGVSYSFNVRAVNGVGPSANSNTLTAAPAAADLFFSCSPTGSPVGIVTNCANMQSSSDSSAVATIQEQGVGPKFTAELTYASSGSGPAGATHQLQMRARCSANCNENLFLKVFDGATFTTRLTILSTDTALTTYSYTMTGAEWQNGAPQIQFFDTNNSGSDNQTSWKIDYVKVVTT